MNSQARPINSNYKRASKETTGARQGREVIVRLDNSPEKITIEGDDYFWQLRHSWLVDSGIGVKGVSISVWRQPGSTRELVIDFPFSVFGLNGSPKRADLIAALIPAIKASIAAGWRPESRGRTFRFKLPAV